MAISRKELIQLVELYRKVHHELGSIDIKISRRQVLDIFDSLKFELESFGKKNCKNFDTVRFQEAILKAEMENKQDHQSAKHIVDYLNEKNNIR